MISCFNNFKSPQVTGEIDITDFLYSIEQPDSETQDKIDEARTLKAMGNDSSYEKIKSNLPCFTLNFSFNARKSNETIKEPTGFIYIDIDGEVDIDLNNKWIYASWTSLSGTGRGVLAKVNGLSLSNFKTTYTNIAKALNVNADANAAKATQYNVHSYDNNLYINEESSTWDAKQEYKKTTNTHILKEVKKKDSGVMGEKCPIRYDNINDYDFDGKDYIFFPNEKENLAVAFIPKIIEKGARNNTLSAIAKQIRGLNPHHSEDNFKEFILRVNRSRCTEPLNDREISTIISKVLSDKFIEPIYNTPRRIIFDPESNLSFKEKMNITNKLKATLQVAKTKKEIEEHIDNWNINEQGNITQKKLANVTGKNIKTIEKYYKCFKPKITSLKTAFKDSKRTKN